MREPGGGEALHVGDSGGFGDLDGVQQLPPASELSSHRSNFVDLARRGRIPTYLARCGWIPTDLVGRDGDGRRRGTEGKSGGRSGDDRTVPSGITLAAIAMEGQDRSGGGGGGGQTALCRSFFLRAVGCSLGGKSKMPNGPSWAAHYHLFYP
jgi:hypothetical protein